MERRRPIGRDNESYQEMLDGLVELAKAADDLGYWGLAHTEHHLHSEGMEISPSPLMLNIHLGAHTRRIMHGQLGLVLPSHDPIRLAEEIAMADHLLRGRLFVGMARGYQSRWMNILCQKLGVGATYSDGSEADTSNRLLFSENFKIMKQAWAQDLLTYDGPTYKVPNPLEGIPDWPPAQTITSRYGAPGEIGDDGTTVKGVSVVPKPYTSPHPPLFQAFGASPPTIERCGGGDGQRRHDRKGLQRLAQPQPVPAPAAVPGVRREPAHDRVVRGERRRPDDPLRSRRAHPRAAGHPAGGPRLRRARHRAGRARRRLPDLPHRRGRPGRGRGARRAAAPRRPLGGTRVARLVRDVRPARPHAAPARRGGPCARGRGVDRRAAHPQRRDDRRDRRHGEAPDRGVPAGPARGLPRLALPLGSDPP